MPLLLKPNGDGTVAKEAIVVKEPVGLRPLLSDTSWRIMKLLAVERLYPAQLAKRLGIHEQSIYYHIRRLSKYGFLREVGVGQVRGGQARYYSPSAWAFALELPQGEKPFHPPSKIDDKLLTFFAPFINGGTFSGRLVVGSPEPHGPNKATARDGHYSAQLALLLGSLCSLPDDFVVKLDVDIKAEREEGENLILVGGPGTNLITAMINPYLPIKFNEKNYWLGILDNRGNNFNNDTDGIVARMRNPFNPNNYVVVAAGLRHLGTKAAIIALTSGELMKYYKGEEEWCSCIRGFDLDGDGKVDSIEILSICSSK